MPIYKVAQPPLDFPLDLCHTTVMKTKTTFNVYQTQPDGSVEHLYTCYTEQDAEDEADRINSNLSQVGIPSSVSCAYYE